MYSLKLKRMLKTEKNVFFIKVICVVLICISACAFVSAVQSIHRPCNVDDLHAQIHLSKELLKVSAKLNNRNTSEEKYLEKDYIDLYGNIASNYSVVSYSLFGSDSRYTDGALANTKLIKTIYPGWKLWLFHDDTVPKSIISSVCGNDHVVCLNMTGSMLSNRMSWRFLVASVPFVSRYVIRDIDSRLSVREKAAVDEWISSGKKFHVMRDHPSHSGNSINGGLWGGTRDSVPNMASMLECLSRNDRYMQDMEFLRDVLWPKAQLSVYQHDSFPCDRYGGGHPFPTKRVGFEHVGSVYINGKMREEDIDLLKKAKPPAQCNTQ